MITRDPWEIFFEGVEQLSDEFLCQRACPARAGITGLIAVLYMLDTDMVIFMLRGLKAPARQRARREKALAVVGALPGGPDEWRCGRSVGHYGIGAGIRRLQQRRL